MNNKYKHSNFRLYLLLGQFAALIYTISNGESDARYLAVLILPLWLLAVKSWLK